MTTPWGDFGYTYDAANRLTSITNPQNKVFTFTYDAAGCRTSLSYPNGIVTNYTYDAAGQVLSIVATRTSDQVVVSSIAYTYDAAGDRTSMTDGEGTHVYSYDNLHRLTEAKHPAGTVLPVQDETFSYDAVGNRLADAQLTGYTYDNANELTSNSGFTYTYDADGNLKKKVDAGSNQTTYQFDSQNEMTGAVIGGVSWAYQYDGQGRRVEKSSGTSAVRYVYDQKNVLAILDGRNGLNQMFTTGVNVDEPLSLHNATSDFSYHQDALGTVEAITDRSGNPIEAYLTLPNICLISKQNEGQPDKIPPGDHRLLSGYDYCSLEGPAFSAKPDVCVYACSTGYLLRSPIYVGGNQSSPNKGVYLCLPFLIVPKG